MLVASLLVSAPAPAADCRLPGAQKPVCDAVDRTHCSQPICVGQTSALNGQVLSTPLALDLTTRVEHADKLLEIEVKFAVSTTVAYWRGELRKAEIDRDAAQQIGEAAEHDRDYWRAASERKWNESPTLWIVVGVLSAAVIAGVAAVEWKAFHDAFAQ